MQEIGVSASLLHGVPMLGLVVKDRGANVKAAGEELVGEEDLGDSTHCAAHLTKSVVDAVVLNSSSRYYDVGMGRDVDLMLKVAAYIRSSDDALRVFKAAAPPDVAHLVPLKDNATRWEGIDISITRALKMKESYKAFCKDPRARSALLGAANQEESDFPSDVFFGRLSVYKELLTPLKRFSKICQKQSSSLMPRLVFLVAEIEDAYAVKQGDDATTASIRLKFSRAVKGFLVPLVRGTTVATKAALLSPESVNIERYLTEDEIKACWKEIKSEALLLLDTDDLLKDASKQACKAQVALARARLASAAQGNPRPLWQAFWQRYQSEVSLFMPIVRLYLSMPISSVKPETVFSYAGELVTKKTARWDVASVEAMVMINDFTRQRDYSFDIVLQEVEQLVEEQARHEQDRKERARKAKVARLQAELQSLRDVDDVDEEDEAGRDGDLASGEQLFESE